MMGWVGVSIVRLQGQERIQDIVLGEKKAAKNLETNFIQKGRMQSDIRYNVLNFMNRVIKEVFCLIYLSS